MLISLSHRNNDYYRPDRYLDRISGFEGAALTRDGQPANKAAANRLQAKIEAERKARIATQRHS